MIKGAVANLLNTYLGQFVEDFGHLDVKAWSGEVNLRNIRIRAEALDMLQLQSPSRLAPSVAFTWPQIGAL